MTPDDWRAMREWLIDARANAERLTGPGRSRHPLRMAFIGQVEVLSSALDFMDSHERAAMAAALPGGAA